MRLLPSCVASTLRREPSVLWSRSDREVPRVGILMAETGAAHNEPQLWVMASERPGCLRLIRIAITQSVSSLR